MPQSHISKIESGRTDIRLSSLIEFARPLDLDLRPVPRAAVPVVEEVVRSTISPSAPPGLIDAAMAVRGLDRALDAADRAQALFPNLEPLEPLGDSLQSLRNRLQGAGIPVRLSAEIRNACAPIHKQLTQILQSVEPMTVLPPEIQESLTFVSCGQSGKRRRGKGGDYQIILSGSSSESFLSAEIKGAW